MIKKITECESLEKKTVLVRTDFNISIVNGKINDYSRVVAALPTLQYLLKKKCKILILSHLGRPDGFDFNLSLKIIEERLFSLTKTRVTFAHSIDDLEKFLHSIQHGEILLMENLRFYKEEGENDIFFAQRIASLADVYVNEAFSCSHRKHASIFALPQLLPSFVGINFAYEVEMLNSIFDQAKRPMAAIIGGAKISTKLKLMDSIANIADYLIVVGALSNNLLYANGIEIGNSLFEEGMIEDLPHYKNIFLPQDVVTAVSRESDVYHVCDVRFIPEKEAIFDIGPATVIKIKKILNQCKTVFWNGPCGLFEEKNFSRGTSEVVKEIAYLSRQGKIRSIVGGGDSVFAINKLKIEKKDFTHISMAGGAFLEWIVDRKLPGIDALKL